jgi:aryl-alcohol dehydrogenase-like predicted oxidoreductase
MERRRLGSSGLEVSAIGLGCNNFGMRIQAPAVRAVVHAALDAGITLYDTADVYGGQGASETLLGKALGPRRQDVLIATKFGIAMDEARGLKGASRRYVLRACEDSLRRLGTEWIDLYYLHRPDPGTPVEETLRALDDLVRAGKVRYLGCSNLPAWQVVEAQWLSRTGRLERFVCAQDEYSLIERSAETALVPALAAYGMGLVPYFPLASGLLTGKYRRGEPPPSDSRFAAWTSFAQRYGTDANWALIERLEGFARERGHTLLELAFAGLLAQPLVASVIAGATSAEQVRANAAAAAWQLAPDEHAALRAVLEPPPG